MSVHTWKLNTKPDRLELIPVPLPPGAETLDAVSLHLPGGAYTTLRTYKGSKVLRFSDHIQRLESTARLAGTSIRLDENIFRRALRHLVHHAPPGEELRFRLTIDLEKNPGDIYISDEPLITPPPAAYEEGVKVITCNFERQLPKAKLTRFIARSGPIRQSLPPGVNEAILVNSFGELMEGLSSNFFAVLGTELLTAEEGVLPGITRSLALKAARDTSVPIIFNPVNRSVLSELEEAFITSASRGLLPVRQIDAIRIGAGAPGKLTRSIMEIFNSLIQNELEMI